MPYLVCDPMYNVDHFLVELDGNVITADAEIVGDQARLHHDVSSVSFGTHVVRAAACNQWGDSAFTDPFLFEKILPGPVSGLGLEA